jgi:hypothetical protein
MRELPRPDIGAALALDIHEEAPVDFVVDPATGDLAAPAGEQSDGAGKAPADRAA